MTSGCDNTVAQTIRLHSLMQGDYMIASVYVFPYRAAQITSCETLVPTMMLSIMPV